MSCRDAVAPFLPLHRDAQRTESKCARSLERSCHDKPGSATDAATTRHDAEGEGWEIPWEITGGAPVTWEIPWEITGDRRCPQQHGLTVVTFTASRSWCAKTGSS